MSSAADIPSAAANAVSGLTTSVTGILRRRSMRSNTSGTIRRQNREQGATGSSLVGDPEEGIEMSNLPSEHGDRPAAPSPATQQRVGFTPDTEASRLGQPSTNSETSSTSRTPSLHPPRTVRQFFSFPTTWLLVYMRQLRHAHEDATKKQVLQRAELRQRVFARDGAGDDAGARGGADRRAGKRRASLPDRLPNVGEEAEGDDVDDSTDRSLGRAELGLPLVQEEGVGWGLGSFGIKEHEASARRLREAGEIMRDGRLLGDEERRAMEDDASGQAGPSRPTKRKPSRVEEEEVIAGDAENMENRDGRVDESEGDGVEAGPSRPIQSNTAEEVNGPVGGGTGSRRASGAKTSARRRSSDWTDIDDSDSSSGDLTDEEGNTRRVGKGWSWWGPLKNWRRTDRSDF